MTEIKPKSDKCSDGFLNVQKCYQNNCSWSNSSSNVWADSTQLSIHVYDSDRKKWTVVSKRVCMNRFGILLPESHCSGCNSEPKIELTWQFQRKSWTNAKDFCLNKGAGWRLFDQFDGKTEHLIVNQFKVFRSDGTFSGIDSAFWVGVYRENNGKFVASSNKTKELSQYFQQFNNWIDERYLVVYADLSDNETIVVNDYSDSRINFIFPCSRYI